MSLPQPVVQNARPFSDVLKDEIEQIHWSRWHRASHASPPKCDRGSEADQQATDDERLKSAIEEAHNTQFVGLAFSGGGIRSATFNLGVLQGLARLKLLRKFDYLSTVSGGGYIGSWFAAWMKRCGNQFEVRDALSTNRQNEPTHSEPHQIHFLRCFSNYLAPRTGLAGADTWTAAAIYLRNLTLNLVILIGAFLALLIIPRLLLLAFTQLSSVPVQPAALDLLDLRIIFAALCLLIAVTVVVRNLSGLFHNPAADDDDCRRPHGAIVAHVLVVSLVVVSSFLLSTWAAAVDSSQPSRWWAWGLVGGIGYTVLWIVSSMVGAALKRRAAKKSVNGHSNNQKLGWNVGVVGAAAFAAGFVGGLTLLVVTGWLNRPSLSSDRAVFVLGLPFVTAAVMLVGILHQGLAGRSFTSDAREWWGRLGAVIALWVAAFCGLFALALFGPDLLRFLAANVSRWAQALIASGWVATTVWGVVAGKSAICGTKEANRAGESAAKVAPFVFVAGLGVVLSWLVDFALNSGGLYDASFSTAALAGVLAAIVAGLVAVVFVFSCRVGINDFSMHAFYRNRLVRAYLGASHKRDPHPFTGFDPNDDKTRLTDLVPVRGYAGPYPIINTALNLVAGEELAWQKRKASSFIFTPLYTGYDRSLQKQTEETDEPLEQDERAHVTKSRVDPKQKLSTHAYRPAQVKGMQASLGTAMAISGAAASPNMGYHTSFPLALLMTVFNVRLGWWLANPRHNYCSGRTGPKVGVFYLLCELFGLTNDKRGYVYLSDGGHFENLGLYELVKRRCRYVVACDASQDRELDFCALGNAIEKCRTDFGIEIELDVDDIAKIDESGHSDRHFVVGKIHYERVDRKGHVGTLVYVKASLTGDEPIDIGGYRSTHTQFPHQSTADQFFDETQFECYRKLGEHTIESLFTGIVDAQRDQAVEEIFVDLKERWYPRSEASEIAFSKHGQELNRVLRTIRSSEKLDFLDAQLYPEWKRLVKDTAAPPVELWLPSDHEKLREGFYTCNELLQLMENVYIDLDLEAEYEHPDNRGWMNLFRHWTWSSMFRVTWAVCSCTSGARFQKFCERHFSLAPGGVEVHRFIGPNTGAHLSHDTVDEARDDNELNPHEAQLVKEILGHVVASKSTLYTLKILVKDVLTGKEPIDFNFGFAVVEANKLVYYRVQDHLRMMGLGRWGLCELIKKHEIKTLEPAEVSEQKSVSATSLREFEQMFQSVKLESRTDAGMASATIA